MKATRFIARLVLAAVVSSALAPTLGAQSGWLSTPEKIDAFRQQVESMNPATTRFELPRVETRTIALEGRDIDIRIYDPGGDAPRPALIYIHGACWVAGSLDSHDEVSRYLAVNGNATVIAIDYRLAPEHPYPAAHEDVFDTIQWIRDQADELGIDPSRLAIAGESAGAHLAAATVVRTLDEGDAPEFEFMLLVYAALDGAGSSYSECKALYFPSVDDARSRYGSPLWVEDLAALPPTFNIYGEYESVRAEQELFIRKLQEDGVVAASFMNPGVGHDVVTWLSVADDLTAHEIAARYIRSRFAKSP